MQMSDYHHTARCIETLTVYVILSNDFPSPVLTNRSNLGRAAMLKKYLALPTWVGDHNSSKKPYSSNWSQ